LIETKASLVWRKGDAVAGEVLRELLRAVEKFTPFHSGHEGYAVILEELDELWDEVKKRPSERNTQKMRGEAVQVAAMAIRFITDVCEKEE